ncbi:MAG: zinc-ribbon domain-containing protein [Endomicrobium sp.]|jgi:hypothetical protein|nr:zinc-ribbon domain-containing protein [Endomicrobium sp.]
MGSIVQTCKECHQAFTLDTRDIEWFKSKGLKIPKRCKSCRGKNKQKDK